MVNNPQPNRDAAKILREFSMTGFSPPKIWASDRSSN